MTRTPSLKCTPLLLKTLLFCLSLILSGCIKTRSQIRQEEKVKSLESEVQRLQTTRAEVNSDQQTLQESLSKIEGKIQELKFQLKSDNDRMITDIQNQLKVTDERNKSYDEKLTDLEVKQRVLIEQVKVLTEEVSALKRKKVTPRTKSQPSAKTSSGGYDQSTPKGLYNNGLESYRAKRYDQAISFFNSSLSKSPKGTYASGSNYHLGEIYLARGKYQDAINAYSQVYEKFPNSYWVGAALYKLGYSFEKMDKKTEAKKFYEEVIRSHPKSNHAANAKRALEKL